MKEFWNNRYAQEAFAYGEEPNEFLKDQLRELRPGTILFPAEGEGRNAVYAAELGWSVSAFDISEEGRNKAERLANKKQVTIDYQIMGVSDMNYVEQQFDAIALIYTHFPESVRRTFHEKLAHSLKKGGLIIIEAFSKKHLDYNTKNAQVGGPKDATLLYNVEEIKTDFDEFEPLVLTETEIQLNEGMYHVGQGSVIRFIGRKKN